MADNTKTVPEIFNEVAVAIQNKKGSTTPINPKDFANEINNLQSLPSEDLLVHLIESSGQYTADKDNLTIALTCLNGHVVNISYDDGTGRDAVGKIDPDSMGSYDIYSSDGAQFYFDVEYVSGLGSIYFDDSQQRFNISWPESLA